MKLSVKNRSATTKSETKTIRRQGDIPAVIYSKGQEGKSLAVSGKDYAAACRKIAKGHLPTTIFILTGEDGSETKAVVKGIEYHPTTYAVLHLDLMELHEDSEVTINVPIEPTGVADCVGIKVGGVLRQVIRHLRVRCLPKLIPSNFELDVQSLSLKQSKRLRDIAVPAGITPVVDLNEVALVIVKR